MNSQKSATILIIDDTPNNLQVLSVILESQGYQVKKAISGKFALQGVKLAKPDLILLDIYMPEIDGYDVCKILKSMAETRDIPVIFISAFDNVADKLKAFEVGGADYIIKPCQAEEVLIRVNNHLSLRSLSQQLQEQNALMQQEIRQIQESEAREREKVKELEILVNQLQSDRDQLLQFQTISNARQFVEVDINNSSQSIFENIFLARKHFQNLIYIIEIYRQTYPNSTPRIEQLIEEINLDSLVIDVPKIINLIQSDLNWLHDSVPSQNTDENGHGA